MCWRELGRSRSGGTAPWRSTATGWRRSPNGSGARLRWRRIGWRRPSPSEPSTLFPSREKVAAKRSDEGVVPRLQSSESRAALPGTVRRRRPLIRRLGRHLLPQRGEGIWLQRGFQRFEQRLHLDGFSDEPVHAGGQVAGDLVGHHVGGEGQDRGAGAAGFGFAAADRGGGGGAV